MSSPIRSSPKTERTGNLKIITWSWTNVAKSCLSRPPGARPQFLTERIQLAVRSMPRNQPFRRVGSALAITNCKR